MEKTEIKGESKYRLVEVKPGADCTGCVADLDCELCKKIMSQSGSCFLDDSEKHPGIWKKE